MKALTPKARQDRYLRTHGTVLAMPGKLIESGIALLHLAVQERGPNVACTPSNHFAYHALGSTLLLISAFEAWLNESTFRLWLGIRDDDIKRYAFALIKDKYYDIPKHFGGSVPVQPDLELALTVRNEIEHFLPWNDFSPKSIAPPHWFEDLERRGLLMTTGNSEVDYPISGKLESYALAYWEWETISDAAEAFENSIRKLEQPFALSLNGEMFKRYLTVCPPSQLKPVEAQKTV